MLPEVFIQRWSPNWFKMYNLEDNTPFELTFEVDPIVKSCFQEAIETFAKEQREICAEIHRINSPYGCDEVYMEILNAPIPS